MRIYLFFLFFFSFILLHRLASVPYSYEHSFFPLISAQWRYRAHLSMVVVCQIEHRTYRNSALFATYRHDTVQYETGTPKNPRVNCSLAKKGRKKEKKGGKVTTISNTATDRWPIYPRYRYHKRPQFSPPPSFTNTDAGTVRAQVSKFTDIL